MDVIEGTRDGRGLVVGVVASRYNPTVTDGLLNGALAELAACGVDEQDVTVVRVPGALELPLTARYLASLSDVDAIVCLGAVIRGDTDHYDFVCSQVTRGCAAVSDELGLPVAFGVLTCHDLAQAIERSSDDDHNKGKEAAETAVRMATLLRELDPDMPLEDFEQLGEQGDLP